MLVHHIGRVNKSLTGFHGKRMRDCKILVLQNIKPKSIISNMCQIFFLNGTFQTGEEEARPALMEVEGPGRPPGPQTLKRPLNKVGEIPSDPSTSLHTITNNQQCCCCCCCCPCYRNLNNILLIWTAPAPKLGGTQKGVEITLEGNGRMGQS